MIPFEEGYARIASLATPLPFERISLEHANHRVLREDLQASRPQPASDISAMDGYAVAGAHQSYQIKGEIAAGQIPDLRLNDGEAVRIFTGAIMPQGADRVLIQENAVVNGNHLEANPIPDLGANIRRQGSDFDHDFGLAATRLLNAADIALIAAMNFADIQVTRRPIVKILATGSELVKPGDAKAINHVIASNAYGIKALAESFGAEAHILPIIVDNEAAITKAMQDAECDLLITTGGASVGKYDYTASAAQKAGFALDIHKIAIRPGKPVMAGKRGHQVFLGLPGNPVSALVGAHLFMRAIINGQLGLNTDFPKLQIAKLDKAISANGDRTHFMRAYITQCSDGFRAEVLSNQDSAALSYLSKINGLVVRGAHEPAKERDERVKFLAI